MAAVSWKITLWVHLFLICRMEFPEGRQELRFSRFVSPIRAGLCTATIHPGIHPLSMMGSHNLSSIRIWVLRLYLPRGRMMNGDGESLPAAVSMNFSGAGEDLFLCQEGQKPQTGSVSRLEIL